jgi:hypothetical protein
VAQKSHVGVDFNSSLTYAMTAIERILWPQDDFLELADEFLVRGCRVRLSGPSITVNAVSPGANAEAVLAAYADALRRRLGYIQLRTPQEFGSSPATSIVVDGRMQRAQYDRRKKVAEARGELVALSHPTLNQCYDYFESAKNDYAESANGRSGNVLSHLYKMVETIEGKYGGERQAKEALGLAEEWNRVKRWANDPRHDQRHASQGLVISTNLEQAMKDGQAILDKFSETFL